LTSSTTAANLSVQRSLLVRFLMRIHLLLWRFIGQLGKPVPAEITGLGNVALSRISQNPWKYAEEWARNAQQAGD
jgi:hypothetical protein